MLVYYVISRQNLQV